MNGTAYIGIDPDTKGGIASITPDGEVTVQAMPRTSNRLKQESQWGEYDMDEIEQAMSDLSHYRLIIGIESGQTNSKIQFASGMMAGLGMNYGLVEMVQPQQWKGKHGLIGSKNKNDSIPLAKTFLSLEANRNITHGQADAILIAAFVRHLDGRRKAAQHD